MGLNHESTTFKGAATFRRALLSENFRGVTNLTLLSGGSLLSRGRYFRNSTVLQNLLFALEFPVCLYSKIS